MRTFLLILILLIVVPLMALTIVSTTPVLTLPASVTGLGRSTPITVQVSDPHGIRHAAATVEQNGAVYQVWDATYPNASSALERRRAGYHLDLQRRIKTAPQLKDGKARLIVEATSNDFRGKTARVEREVMVITHPPSVSVDSDQHYLYLGMADLATFNVSGVRHGIRRKGGRPEIPRMAHARRQARLLLTVRVCLEYAGRNAAAGLCHRPCRQ